MFGWAQPRERQLRLSKILGAALLGVGLLVGPLSAEATAEVPAGKVALSPDDFYRLGEEALDAGRPDVARGVAERLLTRDPNDVRAHILLSRAARDMGDFDLARKAAQTAYELAGNDRQKYAAAMMRAQAEASDGNRTIAQFWLRRAGELAPDARALQTAKRDFRYVRSRNPLSTRLSFGITPTSNINGGSENDTLWLYGLPFTISDDAQALSGLQTRFNFSLERTIIENPMMRTSLGFNWNTRLYTLSSEAKDKAPDARGSDYNFAAAEVFLWHRQRPKDRKGEWDARLTLGHNTYGGDPLSNYVRFDGGRTFVFPDRSELRLGGGLEQQWRLDDERKDAWVQTVAMDYRRFLDQGIFSLGVEASSVDSDFTSIDHKSVAFELGYDLSKPVAGALLGFDMRVEGRDYELSPYSADGREDVELNLGMSVFLPQYDYMGFAPEVGIHARRTNSNVTLYDVRELGMSVSLRSTF